MVDGIFGDFFKERMSGGGMHLPPYFQISAGELGKDSGVAVRIVPDAAALARRMARDLLDAVAQARTAGRAPTIIIPVGPVDQYPVLAELVRESNVSLADVLFIAMDEYLDEGKRWVSMDHPLSFRGFLERAFYGRLDPALAPPPENRLVPDPENLSAVADRIAERGGVDACFGGVGINGHLAFNEPPRPGERISTEAFADLGTRILPLAPETRAVNSITVGGGLEVVPKWAVTIGMREILAASEIRLYANRPWQRAVVRRALYGEVGAECPASLIRRHSRVTLTLTDEVAQPPDVRLR